MGINIISAAWMSRLARRGILHQGGAILDLGPQALVLCPRHAFEVYAKHHRSPDVLGELLDQIYNADNNSSRPDGAAPFYKIFGYDTYRSTDLQDKRATWQMDLNSPTPLPEKFDAITNFGTAEHVFNVCAVFRLMHDALRVGGLGLHVLPAFGDFNHGFFNIHPTTFFDLAAANRYVVEDYCYVDSMDIRCHIHLMNYQTEMNLDELPITLNDLRQYGTLPRKVIRQFEHVHQTVTGKLPPDSYTLPKDYSFVALRKVSEQPFQLPIQGVWIDNPP